MHLSTGGRLGPYEIVAPIGAGGMGEVYKARDTRLDRIVALKVLPPHIASDPELRERFEREARTISQLKDLFAFGAVLYEMVTGRRAFEAKSQASLLAAILAMEPRRISELSPLTPPLLDHIVARCLEKDPDERWQSARDLKDALQWAVQAKESTPASARPRRRMWIVTTAAAVLAAAIGVAAGVFVRPAPPRPDPVTFEIQTPQTGFPEHIAVSPDGRRVAFVATDQDKQRRLWVRSLQSLEARPLAGTEDAMAPFWSFDSKTLGFHTGPSLRRIDVTGGPAQTICKVVTGNVGGGAWSRDGVIVFSMLDGIYRVAASGGEPSRLTKTAAGEIVHVLPAFLPDDRHFVYLIVKGPNVTESSELTLGSVDAGPSTVIRRAFSKPAYASGHLLFRLDGPLMAQPFDPATLKLTGDAKPVAEQVATTRAGAAFSVSENGTLAFRAGGVGSVAQFAWVDRAGQIISKVGPPGDYRNPYLAPNARLVAFNQRTGSSDVWVLDNERGTMSRLTFDPSVDSDPVFSPDGRWIVFSSNRGKAGIYRKASSGAGAEELLAETGPDTYPRDWSADGRFILYDKGPSPNTDIWVLPTTGDRKPFAYLTSPFFEGQGHFSPDGRRIAYTSEETGRSEVFVQDFPVSGSKFQVSTGGGSEPRWRADGGELYYLAEGGQLMAVDVAVKPEFRLGIPKPLFQTRLNSLIGQSRRYGVADNGRRFLMNMPISEEKVSPITVVLNWTRLLEK
jgi:Tol biopolymer transport system component